jgi:hypothetical protein
MQATKKHDQLELKKYLFIPRQLQSNQKHPILKIINAYLKSIYSYYFSKLKVRSRCAITLITIRFGPS